MGKHVVVLGGYAPSLINFRGPLLRHLIGDGHRVEAWAPDDAPEVSRHLAELGATYRRVALARTGLNPFTDLWTLATLYFALRDARPDVLIAYTAKPVIYGTLAARLAGVRYCFALITGLGYAFGGESTARRWLTRLTALLYRIALKGAGVVFFQNPDDRALFLGRRIVPEAKVRLLSGSGVDLGRFAPASTPGRPRTFLMIARLLRDKGVYEFVEAARLVRSRHPDARFVLVGPFDRNPAAIPAGAVEAWQREGVVEYLGELHDVRPQIAACAVYVLPSYREGMPRTVLEAMAMGKPVITTDVPGCRAAVAHGNNGLLVPARDAKALAGAMLQLVENPALVASMGAASLRRAREEFDVNRVNAAMIEAMGIGA